MKIYLVLVQILEVAAGLERGCSSSIDLLLRWLANWHGERADLLLILLMRGGIIGFLILG